MDADGSNQTRLTNSGATDVEPTWSPDGSHIAFESDRDGGNAEIYVMNTIDGSNPSNLTNRTGTDLRPAWSPFLVPEPSAKLSIAVSLLTLSWLRVRRKKRAAIGKKRASNPRVLTGVYFG